MADTAEGRARAEATELANVHLRIHLRTVADLAARGNIAAARMIAEDDVISDLNDIEGLLGESTDG